MAARRAIASTRAPAKPFAANSRKAADKMRLRVRSGFRPAAPPFGFAGLAMLSYK
jgi:hypothetical protein